MANQPSGPLPVPLKVLSLWSNVKSYRIAAVFPSSVCVPAHAPFGGRSSSKGSDARFAGREPTRRPPPMAATKPSTGEPPRAARKRSSMPQRIVWATSRRDGVPDRRRTFSGRVYTQRGCSGMSAVLHPIGLSLAQTASEAVLLGKSSVPATH
eukprot:scaffold44547_cov57-Phaeocystis_antarctica.AAC.2